MSRRLQRSRKLNRAISFMLMLVVVVTMLPLFSMPEVFAASEPTVTINNYAKLDGSYKITDISIEGFSYGHISALTFTSKNTSDVIRYTSTSNVNTSKSYSAGGECYVEFNSKLSASAAETFIKSSIIITPAFATSDSHTLTLKVSDVYGSTIAAVDLAEDTTIGTTADKPYMVFTEEDLKGMRLR